MVLCILEKDHLFQLLHKAIYLGPAMWKAKKTGGYLLPKFGMSSFCLFIF